MKPTSLGLSGLTILTVAWCNAALTQDGEHQAGQAAEQLEVAKVEQILGRRGTEQDGAYKVTVAPNDLSVTVDGLALVEHGTEPRVLFLHYWGTEPAEQLARGLRAGSTRRLEPTSTRARRDS